MRCVAAADRVPVGPNGAGKSNFAEALLRGLRGSMFTSGLIMEAEHAMKVVLLAGLMLMAAAAQPLPITAMRMSPDQLADVLREGKPSMVAADCRVLDLWECDAERPERVQAISLKQVQLDEDPELEAILVVEARAEDALAGYVFDHNGGWNLVGSFFCRRDRCQGSTLMRVQQLTADSPPLLLCSRDLGGSGSSILTTEMYQLANGRLWPVFRLTSFRGEAFPEEHGERREKLASSSRLVIFTATERPRGRIVRKKCEVLRWDATRSTFAPVEQGQSSYCNPRTGKPITGKAQPTGISGFP